MKRDKLMARVAWLWAVTAVTALAPLMVRAVDGSETVTGGGVIEFTGAAEVKRVGVDELLLKFADTETPGTVKLPGLTQMRILAVGGGGGGGGADYDGFIDSFGSGAGGGGGGMLETTNVYDKGLCEIQVGAGGAPGWVSQTSSRWMAENGGNTMISLDGKVFLTAYGGGGGAGHAKGLDGGSGGGGTQDEAGNQFAGGGVLEAAAGQGFPGGKGDEPLYGGGGGGAGGEGADASTKNPVGGIGRQSDITGVLDYYAGGGGGSYGKLGDKVTGKYIEGGLGGGGRGGWGEKCKPTAGEDGKGGGGGGCHVGGKNAKAGAGGDGVVYLRISAAISGSLERPKDQIISFDGVSHPTVAETPFYKISGDLQGTAVGTYVATVSLDLEKYPDLTWSDGSTDDVVVMLAIVSESSLSGSETVLGGGTILYAGASAVSWVENPETGGKDLLLKFLNADEPAAVKFPGMTKARILAIGGGGGGGGADYNGFEKLFGSGAGGGAGGMIEVTNMMAGAVYGITIGAGGEAGYVSKTASKWMAENGGNTTITMNGTEFLTAYGGGGGAGHAKGLDGGSGGGGCQDGKGNPYAGGGVLTLAAGQGFPGGKGDEPLYGGGGGGAGGEGADASTKNPVGGIGRQSDITGVLDYYAGGGGGSYGKLGDKVTGKYIEGGLGGGGRGGWGEKCKPTDGEDGKGGGGGGCYVAAKNNEQAGAGGCGGVYVRISMSFEGDIPKPEPVQSYVYDGNAHTSVVESLAYEIDGPVVGTDVGDYEAKVTLMEGLSWKGGGGREQPVVMHITKAKATISDLVQKDWMFGTPAAAVPKPRYKVNLPGVTVTYGYGEAEAGPFQPFPPTAIGTHWVQVKVEGTANYDGDAKATHFAITKGMGDVFMDYVEITIDGYTGTDPSVLVNFPYKVVLSEKAPNGFLYSRAGTTGHGLTFTDLAGNILPYDIGKWDVDGESYLYVKMPQIGSEPQTIRLYWAVRPAAAAPGHRAEEVWNDWSKEEAAKVSSPASAFDFVARNGYRINYWKVPPEMTKTVWDERDPEPGAVKTEGVLAYGTPVRRFVNAFDERVVYDAMPTTGGAYRVVWEYKDPEGEFEDFRDAIDFTIFGHNPIDVFGDSVQATLSGRVMLVNDDIAEGHGVDYQSYWHVRETDGKLNDIFWEHTGDNGWEKYMQPGSSHVLYHVDPASQVTNLLWHFEKVLIGNTLQGLPSTIERSDGQCFLPWSSTSGPISSPDKEHGLGEEAGNIIMQNAEGAVVYSPIYTNGVGTVYFDAVNGYTRSADEGCYGLAVEIVTGDSAEAIADVPDSAWRAVTLRPLKRDNTPNFEVCPETEMVLLDIKHDKTTNNFYRVCAVVEERGAVRFRIIRKTQVPNYHQLLGCFILIDNIVVSYPKNSAELKPYGKAYDRSRKNKQILGQEAAMTVPFPAAGGVGVRGRGQVSTYANPLNTVDPDTFVSYAKMWYRWRYLDQASNAWDSVELWPANGFVSKTALRLPAKEGDLEFFYELHTQVPYFRYYDYSGLGVGIDESLYTEDTSVVTNAMPAAERLGKVLPSGGTNWFVRLRAGRSDYEGWRLWVRADDESEPVPYDMELVSDRTWRGYFPTPKPGEGEEPVRNVKVRVEALNRQEPGEVMFFENTAYFKFDGAGAIVPWATTTLVAGEGADDWSEVSCDASTGYLLVQLEEQTRGVSVVHADYQDFNKWSDANRKDGQGLFVGTSTDTNSLHMSGSGAKTREFDGNVGTWHLSCPTSQFWSESFAVPEEEMAPGKNWETYKEFKPGQRAPNGASSGVGFTVGRGMWVTGNYRDVRTGMAYQMAGKGEGYLQFMNAVSAPRGIESVSFSARLGQGIGFDDFAYADLGDKPNMTNYTFVTRGAFDLASRSQFSGNASLSVVAGYRAGEGCYEFRVEQQGATFETAASTKVKAAGNTFRISLHRWRYDPAVGDVVSTELGFKEDVTGTDILNTSGESGKFTSFYISLEVRADGTRVSAGMTSSTTAVGNYNSVTTFAHSLWLNDTSADRLDVGGTYGVLTANCPGRFVQPVAYAKATSVSGTWPTATAGYKSISVPHQAENSCRDAIDRGGWAIPRWRMTKYVDPGAGKTAYYGLDATVFAQELEIYTAPVNTDQWTLLTNATISTYGTPGDAGRMTFDVWSKDDCAIRISSGTSGKSERNGIVIDDVVIRQWRGESYDDKEGQTYFDRLTLPYGLPTNFVFTQSWIAENEFGVTNCQLVAKRSQADVATSVRSPLMDGQSGRGIGLGMFSFTYANAQTNVNLLLQVATNGLSETYLASETKAAESLLWTTVTNYSFAALTDAERKSGSRSYYFGYHGVKGAMRLVMDPALVRAVESERDPNKFGSIDITGVLCRDEPKLDEASWWGWNIRTTDEADKASLCDRAEDPEWNGLSFGLNNSIEDGIRTNDVVQAPLYREHLPFLQTPTFVNETVGQVVFKARKYVGDAPARLTLYGAKRGIAESGTDAEWTPLASWSVTNDLFETYSHKTQAGDNYTAFRFAVTGVDGVRTPTLPQTKFPTTPCARVLVDEVLVMEAVRATVSFRNVAAFRTGLEETRPIMNVTDRAQQPLCNEDWGVQAEVYAAQLADEVDLTSARVRLWWHVGVSPWGFDRWKDDAEAKGDCAWLAPCEGTNLVFRSSYIAAKEAVMRAQSRSETVQFMLEVVYDNKDGSEGRSWLTADDWKTPSWYAPLDYNADYGGNRDGLFSAYTIIDAVSPGWAWINEVNIYGGFDARGNNLDKATQFIEIAAPYEANLENWTVRFLDAGVNTGRVITNDVAVFGSPTAKTLPGRKEKPGMDPASKFVFHVIASPKVVTFSEAEGELDGRWKIQKTNSAVDSGGIVNTSYPLAIQLVRPSGIVEHELVAIGTNEWADADSYNPEKHRDFLNAHERGARFFCAPMDCNGFAPGAERSRSSGVFADNGASFMQWNNVNTMTPGRLNEGQVINPDYPKPLGTAMMIYSVVDGPHLNQTFADLSRTNAIATLIFRKGDENGTNITYHVDPWYELGSVTTNGVPMELPSPDGHDYVLNVGRNASNDLTVVARAAVSGELVEKYGLGPNEPYRDAIMDWLSKGRTRYGEFSGPNKGLEKIGLGEFHSLKFDFVTNLTLKTMYWLDMDPTWNDGDLWLMAGTTDIDPTTISPDIRLKVKMVITNTSDLAEAGLGPGLKYWKPYILQSAAPGVSSWEYADIAASWAWSNVTFKVTGIFRNGLTDLRNRSQWIPLRWFVFGPNSFDDNFEAEIDIVDPYSTESPGFNAGWYRWIQDHPGEPKPAVWHAWDIDDRLKPVSVEVLKPANRAR